MAEITVDTAYDAIIVKINGIMHLKVQRSRLLGIQSWMFGDQNCTIELTMEKEDKIVAEYDDMEMWKAILAGLEKIQ